MTDLRRIVVETPCIGCGAFHPGSTLGYCDGPGGSREDRTLPSPEAIEAAAPITRELTSLLPVEFEGSHDATVWTIAIVNAFIRVQFGVSND